MRVLATELKSQAEPPLMKERRFREETSDIIANPRELDQAVTFLHENGVCVYYRIYIYTQSEKIPKLFNYTYMCIHLLQFHFPLLISILSPAGLFSL